MKKNILTLSLLFLCSCTDGFESATSSASDESFPEFSVGELLVATQSGTSIKIYSSTDSGASWRVATQIGNEFEASPLVMLKGIGKDLIVGSPFGAALLNSSTGVWSYFRRQQNGYGRRGDTTYDFAVDGDLYVAATNDGVNISENAGQTWRNFTQRDIGSPLSPTIVQVQIHKGHIFISTLYDIFKSVDRGNTWTIVPFASATNAQFQGNPRLSIHEDFFFVTSQNEGAFRSFDAGATWQRLELPENLPQPKFPAGSQIAGTRIISWNSGGLFLSNDRGSTWRSVPSSSISGSANRWLSEVVMSGNTILVSTYERTTSGFKLHLSRDQGRTWKELTGFSEATNESVTKIGIW